MAAAAAGVAEGAVAGVVEAAAGVAEGAVAGVVEAVEAAEVGSAKQMVRRLGAHIASASMRCVATALYASTTAALEAA